MGVSFDDLKKKYEEPIASTEKTTTQKNTTKATTIQKTAAKEETPSSFAALEEKYSSENKAAEQARKNKENDLIGAKDAEALNRIAYKAETPTLENRENLRKNNRQKHKENFLTLFQAFI